MEVTCQIEWVNIIVGMIMVVLFLFGAAISKGWVLRIINLSGLSVGVYTVTYYSLLGLWLGDTDWTIYAWAVGFAIFVFVSGITTLLSKEEHKV